MLGSAFCPGDFWSWISSWKAFQSQWLDQKNKDILQWTIDCSWHYEKRNVVDWVLVVRIIVPPKFSILLINQTNEAHHKKENMYILIPQLSFTAKLSFHNKWGISNRLTNSQTSLIEFNLILVNVYLKPPSLDIFLFMNSFWRIERE